MGNEIRINGEEVGLTNPEKIERIEAVFSRDINQIQKFKPTEKEEKWLLKKIQRSLPYLAVTYLADLVTYVPVVGKFLSPIISYAIQLRFKGTVKQKKVFD